MGSFNWSDTWADPNTARYSHERRDGERLVKAAIKIIPTAPENSDVQLARWLEAAELSHPHLIPLYEMGRFELRGVPFVYAVMECAEENLAQVLPARALTPAETREMLESVVDVLAYLHGKGFVHGHIKPANIMASGDQLKLSSDALRRRGERLGGPRVPNAYDPPEIARDILATSGVVTPAGDVWSLGMTLVETLTQSLPIMRTAQQQDPQYPQSLPEPFLEIARHCLLQRTEGRWTVAQIAGRLNARVPVHQFQAIPVKVQAPSPAPTRRPVGRHLSQLRCFANTPPRPLSRLFLQLSQFWPGLNSCARNAGSANRRRDGRATGGIARAEAVAGIPAE